MTKTNLVYALIFLSGLLLGWLAIGWWLWPVAYVGDAYTYELNQADKLTYANAVVDAYTYSGIADPAWFSGWYADEIQQALEQVAQRRPDKGNRARALANQMSVVQPVRVKTQNQASELLPIDLLWSSVITVAVCLIVLGLIIGGWILWRNRAVSAEPVRRFETAFVRRTTDEFIPVRPKPSRVVTRAQLSFGPDQSPDQHLPIERDGQHLGEFGVSQVEGEQAWDVWLFDQKALVTVTKVLADQASEELAGRGEVLAWREPFTLETPNLKMDGRAAKGLEDGMKVEITVEGKDEE